MAATSSYCNRVCGQIFFCLEMHTNKAKGLIQAELTLLPCLHVKPLLTAISNGNRTEWSPIQSVIIRVITKSDDCAAGVRFIYHKYDYRQNWTTQSLITN